MQFGASATLNLGELGVLERTWHARVQSGMDQQAHILESNAAMFAPIEHGALKLSVYRVTGDADTYDDAKGAVELVANAGNPNYRVLPKLDRGPTPSAVAGVAAAHGAPINYGFTHNRTGEHIAAQPFWTRALEDTKAGYQTTMLAALQGRKVFG